MIEIRRLCAERGEIHRTQDGPESRLRFESAGRVIMASPNGSHGYLYIAAWMVPQ